MNVKMGFTPWEVQIQHKYFKNKKFAYAGISFSKGKKGEYILAFVGTTNK